MPAKNVTILLSRGPYSSEYADMALKFANHALDKGYDVNMFLYQDGVWVQHANQGPKIFPNIGRLLEEAISKGMQIKACERCSKARGVNDDNIMECCNITGLYDFVDWVAHADKTITFSG